MKSTKISNASRSVKKQKKVSSIQHAHIADIADIAHRARIGEVAHRANTTNSNPASKTSFPGEVFKSSLIDTVRLALRVSHDDLAEIARANPDVGRGKGYVYKVTNPRLGTSAQLISRRECTELIIEASLGMFLTGQNVVGREELLEDCAALILAVLNIAEIPVSAAKKRAIENGKFRLLRVDYAMHCDCRTPERADALMTSLRRSLVSSNRDFSCYGDETLYLGQHSRRKTLRIYRKDIELEKRPLSSRVYRRGKWMAKVTGVVRFELTLRAVELKRLGLDVPGAWNSADARERMRAMVMGISRVDGVVPNIYRRDALDGKTRLKFDAWCSGVEDAFSRDNRKTYQASRLKVQRATGIDVKNPLPANVQRSSFLAVRELFREGLGFKQWPNTWNSMLGQNKAL
jgi:hypothetical protein